MMIIQIRIDFMTLLQMIVNVIQFIIINFFIVCFFIFEANNKSLIDTRIQTIKHWNGKCLHKMQNKSASRRRPYVCAKASKYTFRKEQIITIRCGFIYESQEVSYSILIQNHFTIRMIPSKNEFHSCVVLIFRPVKNMFMGGFIVYKTFFLPPPV